VGLARTIFFRWWYAYHRWYADGRPFIFKFICLSDFIRINFCGSLVMTTMYMQTLHVLILFCIKIKLPYICCTFPPPPQIKKSVSAQHKISGSSVTSLHVVSEGNLREVFSDISTIVSLDTINLISSISSKTHTHSHNTTIFSCNIREVAAENKWTQFVEYMHGAVRKKYLHIFLFLWV
jgi:hypothetical protein